MNLANCLKLALQLFRMIFHNKSKIVWDRKNLPKSGNPAC